MRLYLWTAGKYSTGYTPDWLKISHKYNDEDYELTLDIQETIEYDSAGFDCCCKGVLVPWMWRKCDTGEEVDLTLDYEKDALFTDRKVAELICESKDFEVGIYPVNDDWENYDAMEKDVASMKDCSGHFEMTVDGYEYIKYFKFTPELNY